MLLLLLWAICDLVVTGELQFAPTFPLLDLLRANCNSPLLINTASLRNAGIRAVLLMPSNLFLLLPYRGRLGAAKI